MKKIILNSVGAFIYSIIHILRFFDIYFFIYPNPFGHQTLNVEYFARKVKLISKTKNPILVAFRNYEKKYTIANNSLFNHHKSSGLKIINNRIICLLLDIGLTFQKQQIEKKGGKISTSFLTLTIAQLDTDPDVHLLSDVAFPFNKHEIDKFKSILDIMSLESEKYYIVLDRGENYNLSKSIYSGYEFQSYAYKNQHSPVRLQFKAAMKMKKYNIQAVTMGMGHGLEKETLDSELILDYPSKFRDSIGDIADLALMNGCKFYVGPASGVYAFAKSLKKPLFLCNAFPWPWNLVSMGNTSIVMPKKLWLIKEKRMMTLLEMIKLEQNYSMKDFFYNRSVLGSMSIELILNTEDEIAGGVKEINDRIDKKWNGDNYSLSRILKGYIGGVSQSYLSTYFAENNPDIMNGIRSDEH